MSMRICAFGPLGAGKTLSIVYEARRWALRHPEATVYSNLSLNYPHVRIDNPEILFDIKRDSIVILDELWHIADSHRFMSLINDVMCMLLLRSRRRGWFVGYTQQHWRQTDLRIRYVTELWIMPEMRGKWVHLRYYDRDANLLSERVIDGSTVWGLYDTDADPYTLNVVKLKALWESKNKRF